MGKRLVTVRQAGTVPARAPSRAPEGRHAATDVMHEVERTVGVPLDGHTRAEMEMRFGQDFSGIRVHTDSRAGDLAQGLQARAFAVGSHLVFAPGNYSPSGDAGRRLLAHELSHVIQQRAGVVQPAEVVSEPSDPSERQADRIADAVTAGLPAPELPATRHVADAGSTALQRQPVGKVTRLAERGIEVIAKWGNNASPFKLFRLYYKLNRVGLADLADVSKRVKIAKDLQSYVSQLESSARMLRKAVDEQWRADDALPPYPLETGKTAGHAMVSADELAYVKKYYEAAALVANDAMDARVALNKYIFGWDAVVEQAKNTSDFTREAVWDAVIDLDRRFGGSFLRFLVDARDTAERHESWARLKQYHAADILGEWTPANYRAPTPED